MSWRMNVLLFMGGVLRMGGVGFQAAFCAFSNGIQGSLKSKMERRRLVAKYSVQHGCWLARCRRAADAPLGLQVW